MYQYVVFDLDGTLLNTIDDLANAGNWVCRNHGWPVHSVEEYKRYVGNGMSRLAERFSPEDWHTPERVRAILDEFMPYYNAHKGDSQDICFIPDGDYGTEPPPIQAFVSC